MHERTHEVMEKDSSLPWGSQQWRLFFHSLKHHFEHIGLAHRVEC